MRDNQRYYYLRLKESYFEQESIVLLESMQDGILYSNILLKLCLKSLKHGGRLQLDDNIPYTAQMIAAITRQQIGTVERALQIFIKLGLVEVLENGTLYMSDIELMIGQSSTEGERKRKARQQAALALTRAENESGQISGHEADICPQTRKEVSAAYGRYLNVTFTSHELEELKTDYPAEFEDYIERLSQYMASSGKKYQNHATTIRYWITTDRAKGRKKGGCIPDYSYQEGESL